jgi:hypothetical protein
MRWERIVIEQIKSEKGKITMTDQKSKIGE